MNDFGSVPQPGSGPMFDRIANRYDLLNRVISLGLDRSWRRRTARALELAPHGCVLDLATGTADLALELAATYPTAHVVGLDEAPRMLAIGAHKVERRGLGTRIELVRGDAAGLPFAGASFDACTMAFGIRNMPDRKRVLGEMLRVLRPGGRVAILELSEPGRGWLGRMARWHVHGLVPRVGALLSGAEAYRYLARSIAAFPPPDEFLALLPAVGFERTRWEAMTWGVAHLYLGDTGGTA
jgi:demethylmenaquinone methyltransferase / 2-methoxy-6-polyprenyl-1,4-benzoquinol methylase